MERGRGREGEGEGEGEGKGKGRGREGGWECSALLQTLVQTTEITQTQDNLPYTGYSPQYTCTQVYTVHLYSGYTVHLYSGLNCTLVLRFKLYTCTQV